MTHFGGYAMGRNMINTDATASWALIPGIPTATSFLFFIILQASNIHLTNIICKSMSSKDH